MQLLWTLQKWHYLISFLNLLFIATPSWFSRTKFQNSMLLTSIQVILAADSNKSFNIKLKGTPYLWQCIFKYEPLHHNENYDNDQKLNLTRLNSIARMVFLTSSITYFKEQEISTFRNEIYHWNWINGSLQSTIWSIYSKNHEETPKANKIIHQRELPFSSPHHVLLLPSTCKINSIINNGIRI
mgnify:FL=1